MIVAITGTIASGKSTAARYLESNGYSVIYSDEIARELSKPGKILFTKLTDRYGESVLTKAGELDRSTIAKLAFKDHESVLELDKLTHPFILQEIFSVAKDMESSAKNGVIFVEVPLLIESGFDQLCQQVWLISASDATKTARLAADGTEGRELQKRLSLQRPEAEYREKADIVTENNGGMNEFLSNIEAALPKILAFGHDQSQAGKSVNGK